MDVLLVFGGDPGVDGDLGFVVGLGHSVFLDNHRLKRLRMASKNKAIKVALSADSTTEMTRLTSVWRKGVLR